MCVCVCVLASSRTPPQDSTLTEKREKTFLPFIDKTEAARSQNQQKEGKSALAGGVFGDIRWMEKDQKKVAE